MAPPPLPIFSPSPKPPPPPPWLHGPQNPAAVAPPNPTEAPPKPHHNPKPPRNTGSSNTKPLTSGIPGGRTRRAVLGIIRRVRSLDISNPPGPKPNPGTNSAIPFHLPIDLPQEEEAGEKKPAARAVPWAAARDEEIKVALRRERKVREPTRAERELEAAELERLRRAARGKDRWVRAKKAGVTDEVVEEVRREWARGQELAAVRVVEPLRRCMDRAREILEVRILSLLL